MSYVGTSHLWLLLILVGIVVGFVLLLRMVRAGGGHRPSLLLGDRRECPACKESMRRDARICPHCRSESEPWTFRDGRWWVVRGDGAYYLDESTGAWRRFDQDAPPR